MPDDPHHISRRRSAFQVESLESRALLSVAAAATPASPIVATTPVSPIVASAPLSVVRPSKSRPQTQLVVSTSNPSVNQQQGSFTVNLYLKKGILDALTGAQPAAVLDVPLTVDFSASLDRPGSGTTEAASPIFAPFHESITFPPGASIETVTVPIISSTATPGPVAIYVAAAPAPSFSGVPSAGAMPAAISGPNATGMVELFSSPDMAPPAITGAQLVTHGKHASAVVLGFSKAMAAATVDNIHNYRILSRPRMIDHAGFLPLLFGGGSDTTEYRSFPITAATYDPSTSTVTLTLKRPILASKVYAVSSAYPFKGHELTDPEGQRLGSQPIFAIAAATVPNSDPGGEFTILIHPNPGTTPPAVGPLKTTYRTPVRFLGGFS
jgi:hypothetical protein